MKKTQIKIEHWVSTNQPSNNWAQVHKLLSFSPKSSSVMQGSCQSKTHLLCHYNFFLTCFHMLRLHEKCFIICMLEVQKFVLVQILSWCQFVNNENIKNKIIWLNVGTSLVLQETPLKAAFKFPT